MKIRSGRIGGSYSETDWTLEDPSGGVKTVRRHVDFGDDDFSEGPCVVLGIVHLDTAYTQNVRVNATAENITNNGFDVVFTTWADSKTYGVQADWLAYVCP